MDSDQRKLLSCIGYAMRTSRQMGLQTISAQLNGALAAMLQTDADATLACYLRKPELPKQCRTSVRRLYPEADIPASSKLFTSRESECQTQEDMITRAEVENMMVRIQKKFDTQIGQKFRQWEQDIVGLRATVMQLEEDLSQCRCTESRGDAGSRKLVTVSEATVAEMTVACTAHASDGRMPVAEETPGTNSRGYDAPNFSDLMLRTRELRRSQRQQRREVGRSQVNAVQSPY